MDDVEPGSVVVIGSLQAASYTIISFLASKLPETYVALVFSKWLRSHRYGNPHFRRIDSAEYYKNYRVYIEKLLAKPDSKIRLAVLTDDHDIVLGFSVSREDVLDYIHVQADYRKTGIGRKLFPEGTTTFTHVTTSGIHIWQSKNEYKKLKYNPYA